MAADFEALASLSSRVSVGRSGLQHAKQAVTTRVLARESNEPEGQDFELKENSFSD